MPLQNVLCDLPDSLAEEVIESLLDSDSTRIERIVSHGQCSPPGFWYDQQEHEWVLVLRGSASLAFDDGEPDMLLRAGDFVHIPARRRHRVEWTTPEEPTIWLAVFYSN